MPRRNGEKGQKKPRGVSRGVSIMLLRVSYWAATTREITAVAFTSSSLLVTVSLI